MRTEERRTDDELPREGPHKNNGRHPGRRSERGSVTSSQILGEIRDYCRATKTAESTFGRLAVNDGKLVSRLRDGANITTETLDKVRAFLVTHRPGPPELQTLPAAAAKAGNASAAPGVASPGFRFFDNRQKYLLFVSTCGEKTEIANRISLELGNLQPSPPALRLFDAGVGDGTVLSRVMRALHARFPTMPLYVVAKEISYEDVRMMLEKMADRLFEHPATVLVVTNLYYAEAPWLTPRSVTSAQGLIWKDVALAGNTAHGFAEQIGELEPFLVDRAGRHLQDDRRSRGELVLPLRAGRRLRCAARGRSVRNRRRARRATGPGNRRRGRPGAAAGCPRPPPRRLVPARCAGAGYPPHATRTG